MKYIDTFLNSITMYRLVMWGLALVNLLAIFFGFIHVIDYGGWQMLISWTVLMAACWISNTIFARVLGIPENIESSFITAFILFFILPPPATAVDGALLVAAAIAAMLSKYFINIKGKHIFNPAAFGAVVISLSGMGAVSWWVGTPSLLIPIAILGLLMVRKIRWSWLFFSFIIAGTVSVFANYLLRGVDFYEIIRSTYFSGPIIFFGAIMLTEPMTTPPTRKLQIIYGVIVGVLYGTPFHFGPISNNPQLTLVLGNIYSYLVSPKERLILKLKEKIQLAPLIYDFVFSPNYALKFIPGQYLEWTVDPAGADTRGNRRYFSLASAPSDEEIRIGVKIPGKSSTFKQKLLGMKPGDQILGGRLAGDFSLPQRQQDIPIVGIAGGIGITPFRSIIKNAVNQNTKLNLVLFYSAADPGEFVYKDLLEEAKQIGVKTIFMVSGKEAPSGWTGKVGYITPELIKQEVPGWDKRHYYLSGPNAMVDNYKRLLSELSISKIQIHSDYFPGY